MPRGHRRSARCGSGYPSRLTALWPVGECAAFGRQQAADFCSAWFRPRFFRALGERGFLYKCDEYYHPEDERGVAWNDPELGIDWQLPPGVQLLLSAKDHSNPALAELEVEDLPRF